MTREGIRLTGYAPNAGGVTRSPSEAVAIARKHGVEVPEWVRVVPDASVPPGRFAEYRLGGKEAVSPNEQMSWKRLAPTGTVTVRVHPSVFHSDEAVVGVLAHESYELTRLRRLIEARGAMPAGEVQRCIDPRLDANLHGQAWDIADLQVMAMRAETAEARAAVRQRLEVLQAKYDRLNGLHGGADEKHRRHQR